MQYRDMLLFAAIACPVALLLITLPSYEFLTTEDAYLGPLNDESWLSALPDELSVEVAGAIGDALFLSPHNKGVIAEYLSGRVTVTWAREQGESAIHAIVSFIRGESDSIEGYVDITVFRQSLLGMLYGLVPPLLADLISGYVPAELPLSLILHSDDMDGFSGMMSLLGALRVLALACCAAVAGIALLRRDAMPATVWLPGVGASGILAIIGICIVRSRILASFDAASVGFVSSYGKLFAKDYVHDMAPVMFLAVVLAIIGLIALPLWRKCGSR